MLKTQIVEAHVSVLTGDCNCAHMQSPNLTWQPILMDTHAHLQEASMQEQFVAPT